MEVLGKNIPDLDRILSGCRADSVKYKEMLYKSHYGYLKGVVFRYVQDFHTVEELVNDSFMKIFNNITSFKALDRENGDLKKAFKSWTAKIASRTAIDFLRKKNIVFATEEISESCNPVVAGKSSHNEVKDIMLLLNELPQTQQLVFNLYEIEGFSHEEISGILSISESVSRSYLSRAKQKLKSLYVQKFLN